MELPQQYPYNPKWSTLVMGEALFGGGAFFLAYMAGHPDEGLRCIPMLLGPEGAAFFYWVAAALSGILAVYILLLTARRLVVAQSIELLQDTLVLPRGWLQSDNVRVPYAEIDRVWETERSGQSFLFVSAAGRQFKITASCLPDKKAYSEVREFLVAQQTSR